MVVANASKVRVRVRPVDVALLVWIVVHPVLAVVGLQKCADELAVGIVLSKCRTDQVIKLAEVTSIESELSAVQISLQGRHV